MPITVVLDHPRRHTLGRLWRGVTTAIGSVLFATGIIASVVAFSLTLAVGFVLVASDSDGSRTGVVPGALTQAWVISLLIAVAGLVIGVKLLRGHRRLVLFLRRFGYVDATKAVTFAVTKTIGRSWRLVTLDDAEVAPLGVAVGPRRVFRVAEGIGTGLGKAFDGTLAVVRFVAATTIIGIVVVFGIAWSRHEPLGTIVAAQVGEPFHADLHSAFSILFTGLVVSLALGGMVIAARLVTLPFAIVIAAFGSAERWLAKAEASKAAEIHDSTQIAAVSRSLARGSRRILAPRLVVLRVGNDVWQQTVRRLASASFVSLVDVSEPTENLLWEIGELRGLASGGVFVGDHDRVMRLGVAGSDASAAGSLEDRLVILLDGEEVLAYTTDDAGMKRFARALRAKLQSF